jgi:hypothetical protein
LGVGRLRVDATRQVERDILGSDHLRRIFLFAAAIFACSSESASNRDQPGAGGGGPPGGVGGAGGSQIIQPIDASISAGDASSDAPIRIVDGSGIVNDSRPAIEAAACTPGMTDQTPGPLARRCAPPTDNECDGKSDVAAQWPNGPSGNGFDDDCDGHVDEGCSCDAAHPVGTTKACALVSPSQVDPNGKPAGWCAVNSIGTMRCIATGKEILLPVWDGECRGAQPPFADDVCARGDFDCDGKDLNSRSQDCQCKVVGVGCPTAPVVTTPFPDPNNLPAIDGSSWVMGGAGNAKNWKWTVTGGDCDNILPHPTFAVYGQRAARRGGPRLSGNAPQTRLGPNANQQGFVIGPGATVGPVIYPAFALSGDYLVKGEWDASDGHHACTVKVEVRSPGIRVELCWSPQPEDIDLHFARLQNPKACTHGWMQTCAMSEEGDDCYFNVYSGCLEGFSTNPSAWGYARSPNTACHGWGSTRQGPCDNPRLDQDNRTCILDTADPLDDLFCGPENINLDNPKDGDRFAVGAAFYWSDDVPAGPVRPTHPHLNVYCNGERKLAFGFDPSAGAQSEFPVMKEYGQDTGGDFWAIATIDAKVSGGMLTDCVITPIHSKAPKPDKDGSKAVCVDTNPMNGPMPTTVQNQWKFTANGGYPANADGFCWH